MLSFVEFLTESTIVDSAKNKNAKVYRKTKHEMQGRYPQLKIASGIGLCAFASYELQRRLKGEIELEIIIGRKIADTRDGHMMYNKSLKVWERVPKDDFRYKDAQYVLKHKPSQDKIGHAVCYDGETIIDITSAQFGLPMFYSLDDFNKLFKKVERDRHIKMKSIKDYGII